MGFQPASEVACRARSRRTEHATWPAGSPSSDPGGVDRFVFVRGPPGGVGGEHGHVGPFGGQGRGEVASVPSRLLRCQADSAGVIRASFIAFNRGVSRGGEYTST